MRAPPPTVLAYVGKWAVIVVAALILAEEKPRTAAGALILAAALIGLLRGSRIAWMSLVALEVVAVASVLLAGTRWWVFPLSVVALALLVVKPTRKYVGRARSRTRSSDEPR